MQYLFNAYRKIIADSLLQIENQLCETAFDITQPMVLIFNEIKDLQSMATAADNPCSDMQLVNLGIKILKNMNDLEKGLIDWYACPAATNTWQNFKTHVEDLYQALRQVCGDSMKNTIFQQKANVITSSILQEIRHDHNSVREEIRNSKAKLFSVMEQLHVNKENIENASTITPSVNSATSDQVQLEILKTLKELKMQHKKIHLEGPIVLVIKMEIEMKIIFLMGIPNIIIVMMIPQKISHV